MVLLASRSSTYDALGILLLITSYTSTFSPDVFAEDISCSSFAARRLLYAAPFMLSATCYSLLPLCCLITVWFLLLTGWTPSFWLLGHRRSPLVSSMLTTCHRLIPADSSWLFFRFFSFFDSSLDLLPRAPRG